MLDLVVRSARAVATDVTSLELAARDGARLPPWSPGAHLDLHLPSGLVRSYSLHGDHRDRGAYHVAVLNVPDGRGGSAEVHRIAAAGTAVGASSPRNAFALQPASHYLFLAGGIGVTPLLAMAREIARRREPWTFVYGGRSRNRMAFLDALAALPGGQLQIVPQDEAGLPDLAAAFAALPAGAAAYCCGPAPMLEAAQAAGGRTRPDVPVRLERFAAAPTERDPSGDGRLRGGAGPLQHHRGRPGRRLDPGRGAGPDSGRDELVRAGHLQLVRDGRAGRGPRSPRLGADREGARGQRLHDDLRLPGADPAARPRPVIRPIRPIRRA